MNTSAENSSVSRSSSGMLAQAGILAAAGIVVRIIGLLYRSPLTSIIGDEGNGYYNSAYNCYAIILLISAYSIPSAISKVMAEKIALGREKEAQRIFHGALLYVLIVSGAFSVFLFFGAGLLTVGQSVAVLRVFSPTILLFGLLGVLRGYFQARRTMVPTSVSQILEQIVNAVMSVLAAWLFIRMASPDAGGTERAVRGAIGSALGTGAGVLAALLFMIVIYFANRGKEKKHLAQDTSTDTEPMGRIMKLLFLTVTPFILSTFIYNFSTMLDQTIFQRILLHLRGYRESVLMASYGVFSTKAVVIANIPIALSSALSSAMMPNLSGSYATGDISGSTRIVRRAMNATLMVAIPCAVGLAVLARPVMQLLFPQKNSLEEASFLLAGMAVTVIFYSISTVSNAVLQAIGRMNLPVINAALALLIQGGLLALLLICTDMENGALVIAAIVYSGLMCLLNRRSLHRHLVVRLNLRHAVYLPVLASTAMGAVALGIYEGVSRLAFLFTDREYLVNLIALMPAIFAAIWIYALLLIRLGGIGEKEIRRLPKGRLMVGFLKKIRIL